MATDTFNDGTSFTAVVSFYDANNVLEVPTAITTEIICLVSGKTVRAETAFTPVASSINVLVTTTENTLIDASSEKELKRLIVRATYGAGEKNVTTSEWEILNVDYDKR